MDEIKPRSKTKKVIIIVVLLIITSLACGYLFLYGNSPITNSVKVPYPYTMSVAGSTSFACASLVSANVIGSPEEYLTNGIEGSVEKGTDKIAMNIKDAQTLNFMTAASVRAGMSEGDNFAIVQNDDQKLIAVWFNENAISTVVLNKTNGLAVWLKGNPDYMLYGAPYGSAIYMICT
jgi:hypothetical protein